MTPESGFYTRVQGFVERVVLGLGLRLDTTVADEGDHVRIKLAGEDSEPLLRRKGEALDALQHVVNSVFRHEVEDKRLVVDCEDFRKARDREVRQMARFLIDKVRTTGLPQQLGPLNSYSRRLVHLEVAEAADMQSISDGEGAAKRVTIRLKPAAPPAR
jgi:spoIIIJ-associated protein